MTLHTCLQRQPLLFSYGSWVLMSSNLLDFLFFLRKHRMCKAWPGVIQRNWLLWAEQVLSVLPCIHR